MSHLDEGRLHAWLDGEIDGAEALALEAHLQECPACAAMLERSAADRAEATALLGELDSVDAMRATTRPTFAGITLLAWAASLALAVTVGWLARSPAGQPETAVPTLPAPAAARDEAPPQSRVAAESAEPMADAALAERRGAAFRPAESAAQPARGGGLRMGRADDSVVISEAQAAAFLGATPRQMGNAVPVRLLLQPSDRSPGGGAGVVVVVEALDPEGRMLRLWQQRVDALPTAAEAVEPPTAGFLAIGWVDDEGIRLVLEGEVPASDLRALIDTVR